MGDMSETSNNVVEMPRADALTEDVVHSAVRNDYGKVFKLGSRSFDLKDLQYDDYVQFMKLASPIVKSVVSIIQPTITLDKDQKPTSGFDVDFGNLDLGELADLAGHNLPLLAQLCCKQSFKNITVSQVKDLSMERIEGQPRGPIALIGVVLTQVAHNKMVEEFVGAFPQLGSLVQSLAPNMVAAMTTPTSDSTPTS
jgi:hypothetical protein